MHKHKLAVNFLYLWLLSDFETQSYSKLNKIQLLNSKIKKYYLNLVDKVDFLNVNGKLKCSGEGSSEFHMYIFFSLSALLKPHPY